VVKLLKFKNCLLKLKKTNDEEEGSGDESSGGGRTVTMTKMVEMRRALIVRLAPRRLTSSDEIMFEHSLLMSL
jgi:hypothetical protein